ncbi:MAG TPA: DUF2812 domain-containing protein [Mobilitalea sp.]|nr:DUF2812 domain-containing protein [Mobilitalea sp.]
MKGKKYVLSGGLAFSEDKDLRKLEKYASEGWILERFAFLGYHLRNSEPIKLQYSLDYQLHADKEYFNLFEEAGWSHVCSAGSEIHIFSAQLGTKPIYSDITTIYDKYEREKAQMKRILFPFLFIFILLLIISITCSYYHLPPFIVMPGYILTTVSYIIMVFSGLPFLAYTFKLKKIKNY